MATAVELPQLGNTVEECLVTRWVKRQGDTVATGDVVAEIETDKTTFEITAPVSGTVLATFFDEGALVKDFTNLFVIGEPGEDAASFDPRAVSRQPPASARSAPLSPRARSFAAQHDFHPTSVAGSGPGGRVLESDVRRELMASKAAATPSSLRA